MTYFGAIETGGTRCSCAIGDDAGNIIKKEVFPTIKPEMTMPQIFKFFIHEHAKTKLDAIGIACFGPLDLHKESPTYGSITTTPKPSWSHFNIVQAIKTAVSVPIGFDTDVNGAALGEQRWGAAAGIDTFIYITVGTGIGVGGIIYNHLMHGLIHPEMGHISIPRYRGDNFESVCPFHENCLEGLASGPAIEKRWNVKAATDLPDDHEAWDLEAYYLGTAIANWSLTISPKKVILGGGLLNKKSLMDKVRKECQKSLNGYLKHKIILGNIDEYIVFPKRMGESGLLGALALAERAREV
ncbi:MAG: putative fructokinase [Candidatus Anoxychlamydiales bacterium]|nr:putative fructokinase [Candidatus Anoxychlamydiales bacterium]